jgi:endogenous inhibitor of DNA gyrase (YacG/DUF329 family)
MKMSRADAGKLGWEKSKHLHTERNAKIAATYNANPKLCKTCKQSIPFDRRRNAFCNQSCSAIYTNCQRKTKHEPHPCGHCGVQITVKLFRKFCSTKCLGADRWEQRKIAIVQSGMIPSGAHLAKRYLTELKGYKCELCGINEWKGERLPLILDHIDGNSDNWLLTNLRQICSNCDSILPTYKGRNKGKGRHTRRIRYAQGKSF